MSYIDEEKATLEQIEYKPALSQQEIDEYHGTAQLNIIPSELENGCEIVSPELSQILEGLYQKEQLSKVGQISNPTKPPQSDKGTKVPTAKWEQLEDVFFQMAEAVFDVDNYPTNIPDKETCAILDKLMSEEKLPARKVIYAKTIGDMMREVTKVFEEYSYNGRKFVREKAQNSGYLSNEITIVEGNYYWIEVKPNVIDKTNDMEEGSKSI